MADTVKIGNVNVPKQALILGVVGGAAVIFYAYYTRGSGSGDGGDVATGDPGIDPETGLPYFDDGGYGGGYSGIGVNDPGTGGVIGGGYGNQIITGNTTNAMWTQAVILYFNSNNIYPEDNVSNALGKVLTGRPVTVAELNIFNAARAVQGEPPQGYPTIQMVSSAPPGTTNPSGASLPAVTGLRVTKKAKTSVAINWNPVRGAAGYTLYRNGSRVLTVVYSAYTFQGLKPRTKYTFKVVALGHDNKPSAKSASVTATTAR